MYCPMCESPEKGRRYYIHHDPIKSKGQPFMLHNSRVCEDAWHEPAPSPKPSAEGTPDPFHIRCNVCGNYAAICKHGLDEAKFAEAAKSSDRPAPSGETLGTCEFSGMVNTPHTYADHKADCSERWIWKPVAPEATSYSHDIGGCCGYVIDWHGNDPVLCFLKPGHEEKEHMGQLILRKVAPEAVGTKEPEFCNAGPSRNIPIEEMRAVIEENEDGPFVPDIPTDADINRDRDFGMVVRAPGEAVGRAEECDCGFDEDDPGPISGHHKKCPKYVKSTKSIPIAVGQPKRCGKCDGTGRSISTADMSSPRCPNCLGTGEEAVGRETRELTNDQQLTLSEADGPLYYIFEADCSFSVADPQPIHPLYVSTLRRELALFKAKDQCLPPGFCIGDDLSAEFAIKIVELESQFGELSNAVQDLLEWLPTCSVGSSGHTRRARVEGLLRSAGPASNPGTPAAPAVEEPPSPR